MAIAFDAVTGPQTSTGTTHTWAHTCSGSNRILFVGLQGDSGDLVSGVTYSGVAMTLVGKVQVPTDARWSYLYYLIAPATGSNNVVVTSSSSNFTRTTSVSYTGAKQSGVPDASTTGTATSSPLTLSVTTVAANCWTVMSVRGSGSSLAAGTGTTMRGTASNHNMFDSNGAIASPGSTSLQATTSTQFGGVMASFAPDVTVAGNTHSFFMGME